MQLSNLLANRIKRRASFVDLEGQRTPDLLQELSFADYVGGGVVWLPLGKLVITRIKHHLRSEVVRAGMQELDLPTFQPVAHWQRSGRMAQFDKEVVSVGSNLLYPTSEEPVAAFLARDRTLSHRELPMHLFSFRKMFRRPGDAKSIIRLSEFEILDMYSINNTHESLQESVDGTIAPLFERVWATLKLNVVACDKREGYIDFKFLTPEGDDVVIAPRKPVATTACISIGVIMDLGNYYSRAFNLTVHDQEHSTTHPHMGSYAIGIERLFYALAHQNKKTVDGRSTITWPQGFAPFDLGIVPLGLGNFAMRTYLAMQSAGIAVLYDNAPASLGLKIRRMYALGIPAIAIIGQKEEQKQLITIENTASGVRQESILEDVIRGMKNASG
jgi:prolyl-tRNA synthetase